MAVSARLMRRILVDWARSRHYLKRRGEAQTVSLEEAPVVSAERGGELVALPKCPPGGHEEYPGTAGQDSSRT